MKAKRVFFCLILLRVGVADLTAQHIANFVSNGSFEDIYSCTGPFFPLCIVKNWMGPDTACPAAGYFGICNNMIPLNGNSYQFPFKGNSLVISTIFIPSYPARGYPKNRLKGLLQMGRTYCVKYYVNISNNSPFGIDGFGAYFGGNAIDTITQCNVPLSYLSPQVQNPIGNVITDTLNWTPIAGTFTAAGDEKYMLLGNFLADNAVTTASIGGPYYPQLWTDVLFDYASCIDIDLPAYGGADSWIVAGDSTYIGRESDVEIDESCIWYKMTSPTTSVTIDTIAGLWVKPVVTTTYVVRQQLWCSGVKWDTVVVSLSGVGFEEFQVSGFRFQVWPNPVKDDMKITYSSDIEVDLNALEVYNVLGQLKEKKVIQFKNKSCTVDLGELPNGAYLVQLKSEKGIFVQKRIVVSR
ncbi:MAG TPA: T9SS type A sorting domain-containing protein [Bacteroidia bacterium]|nr:T9SS type A sorting domain-containing protein [Bacteroidia bacterium]